MSGHLSVLKRFLRNLQRHPELGCWFHMAQLQHLHQQVWYFLKLDVVRERQPRLQMPGTRALVTSPYRRFWEYIQVLHSCGWKKLCPIWLYLLVNWDSQKALLEPLSQQVGPYLTRTARNFSVIMCLSWQVFFKVTGQLRYVACKSFPPMAAEAQPRETRGGGSWPCLFSRPIPLKTPSTALAALSWHSVWRIAPRDVASFAASGLWTNRCSWACKVLQQAAGAPHKNTRNCGGLQDLNHPSPANKDKKLFSFPPHSQPKIFPTLGPPTDILETLLKLSHQGSWIRHLWSPSVRPYPWLLPSSFWNSLLDTARRDPPRCRSPMGHWPTQEASSHLLHPTRAAQLERPLPASWLQPRSAACYQWPFPVSFRRPRAIQKPLFLSSVV